MKRVIVRYGCGYGSHTTDFEVDDDCPEEDIENDAKEVAMERFDWSWKVEE